MNNQRKMVVLITGASSGIGLSAAQLFANQGHIVYGTSRHNKSLAGIRMLKMDVRNDVEVIACVDLILAEQGRLDILVGNAGIVLAGSVEDTNMAESQAQFDTNYFGALRVVRAVLPIMRQQGGGSIITIGSVAGILSLPFQAGYSSTKYALEATMEALRCEVFPFGIRVCIVEPGDTKTGLTASRVLVKASGTNSAYSQILGRSIRRVSNDEQNGVSPDKVAKTIVRMALSRNPPVRIAVGFGFKIFVFLKRILPNRVLVFLLRSIYAS